MNKGLEDFLHSLIPNCWISPRAGKTLCFVPLYSEALSDNKGLQFSKSFINFSVIQIIGTAWAFTEKTEKLSLVFSPSCNLTFGHFMLMLGKNTQRGCRAIIVAHKTNDFWCFYSYCHGHYYALYYRLIMNNLPFIMEGCPRLRQIIIIWYE